VLIVTDRTVVDPEFLTRLLETAVITQQAGLWGPKIPSPFQGDSAKVAAFRWDSGRLDFVAPARAQTATSADSVQIVDALMDCGTLIRRDVFDRIGMLSADFSLRWAIIDFCTRAARHEVKCLIVPAAIAWREDEEWAEAEPTPLQKYFATRDRLLWARRHLPFRELRAIWRQELLEIWRMLPALPRTQGARRFYWWGLETIRECRRPLVRLKVRALFDYLVRSPGKYPRAIHRLTGAL